MEIRWQSESTEPNAPFQQSGAYATAAARCGSRASIAEFWDGPAFLGSALVLERLGLRLISRGPTWRDNITPESRRRGLRLLARRLGPTIVTSEHPVQGFGIVPLVTPCHHAIWNISPAPAQIMEVMKGKWRNRVAAALRGGVRITMGDHKTFENLLKAEAAQRQHKGYRGLPEPFLKALPQDALSLWQWHSQGQMHAAMCFVRHGGWATYLMGWADHLARGQGVHNAMLWAAALHLRGQGHHQIDLGLVDDENAPGLAHFKLGTGADLRALGSTCLILPG